MFACFQLACWVRSRCHVTGGLISLYFDIDAAVPARNSAVMNERVLGVRRNVLCGMIRYEGTSIRVARGGNVPHS